MAEDWGNIPRTYLYDRQRVHVHILRVESVDGSKAEVERSKSLILFDDMAHVRCKADILTQPHLIV